jgi:very-short-patch-repair endonuclease
VVRTLFDLARVLPGQQLERLVDELLAAGIVKLGPVAGRFSQYRRPGRTGVAALAFILDARGPGYVPPASELEALLRDVLQKGGHPQPDWQRPHPAGSAAGRVDAVFESCKLIVEVDGRRWHSQVEQMEADRHRDIGATLAGYHTMRFMWGDLVMRADWVNRVVGQHRKLWAQ